MREIVERFFIRPKKCKNRLNYESGRRARARDLGQRNSLHWNRISSFQFTHLLIDGVDFSFRAINFRRYSVHLILLIFKWLVGICAFFARSHACVCMFKRVNFVVVVVFFLSFMFWFRHIFFACSSHSQFYHPTYTNVHLCLCANYQMSNGLWVLLWNRKSSAHRFFFHALNECESHDKIYLNRSRGAFKRKSHFTKCKLLLLT